MHIHTHNLGRNKFSQLEENITLHNKFSCDWKVSSLWTLKPWNLGCPSYDAWVLIQRNNSAPALENRWSMWLLIQNHNRKGQKYVGEKTAYCNSCLFLLELVLYLKICPLEFMSVGHLVQPPSSSRVFLQHMVQNCIQMVLESPVRETLLWATCWAHFFTTR